MGDGTRSTERRFEDLAGALATEPGVTYGQPGAKKTFGHSALKVNDKISAMVSSAGHFVVKLPKGRVDALEAAGEGKRFEAGKGSPMKECVVVNPEPGQDWLQLAYEALSLVRCLP